MSAWSIQRRVYIYITFLVIVVVIVTSILFSYFIIHPHAQTAFRMLQKQVLIVAVPVLMRVQWNRRNY